GAENPPGKEYISGSQDHIGLLFPGINRLYYNGDYWPEKIDSTIDPEICNWLSNVLHLIPLEPRPQGYDPLKIMHLEKPFIKELGESGNRCWKSILKKDIVGLGRSVTDTILSWKKILPLTVPDYVMDELETKYFPDYPGAITSGSGGGYVIVVSEKPIEGAVRVKVRC
ncbi:MAG: cytidyltransferase, partial [Acidobacteria bacterium]|nr:cytidyltransferase [Acidobacteriota bacterium]